MTHPRVRTPTTRRNHFTCTSCGWETWAPDHVIQVFPPCKPAKQRRRLVRIPQPKSSREEHRTDLYHALVEAQGPESIWRPLDANSDPRLAPYPHEEDE